MPPKAVEHVDTALEALTLSIAEKARVDFEYMGKLDKNILEYTTRGGGCITDVIAGEIAVGICFLFHWRKRPHVACDGTPRR